MSDHGFARPSTRLPSSQITCTAGSWANEAAHRSTSWCCASASRCGAVLIRLPLVDDVLSLLSASDQRRALDCALFHMHASAFPSRSLESVVPALVMAAILLRTS